MPAPVGRGTGAGRRKGSKSKTLDEKVREAAKATGKLPHEILLDAARGECFKVRRLVITYHRSGPKRGYEKSREWVLEDHYPSYSERIEAAKAAAPYYAPRLAAQTIDTGDKTVESLSAVLKELGRQLPG